MVWPTVETFYFDAVYGRLPAGVQTLVGVHGCWYIEVKERAIDVPGRVDRIGVYGREGVNVNASDWGNGALRKAST